MTGVIPSKRRTIWLRDGGRCHYCDISLSFDECTADHVWPIARGGKHANSSLVCSCAPCNRRLGDRTDKCGCFFCRTAIQAHGSIEARVAVAPPAGPTVAELAGWVNVDDGWVRA